MNKTWTDKQIKFLIDNYPILGSQSTAKALDKSDEAVRQKASKLKLKGKRLTIAEKHREVQAKECSRCHQVKPFSGFHKAPRYAYGYNAWCKVCISDYLKKRRQNNPDVVKRELESHQHSRIETMLKYCPDGVLKCACCGETEPKFLAIDHINGGGNQHRKEIGRSKLHHWLKPNHYPSGFQVLCHNCNLAKGFYGICPHQLK